MMYRWMTILAAKTSILPESWANGGDGIQSLLNLIVKILVYGLGAAAVIGVIVAGILYLTARDNEQQVVVAKKRLYDVVIGLVAWALMWTVLNWLLPGSVSLSF